MNEVPRPEHPRPLLQRETWANLNGEWHFTIGSDEVESRILVPFPPESSLSGVGIKAFMPAVEYRRTFRVPWASHEGRTLLHFGAVDYEATVWLNGCFLGAHRGGYTPFSFEIGDMLQEGENELHLKAVDDNRTGLQPCGKQSQKLESYGCRYTRVTGIWQTVWIEAVGPSYVENVVVSRPRESNRVWVMAEVDQPQGGEMAATVSCGGDVVGKGKGPASRHTKIPVDMDQPPDCWGPGHPLLYDLDLELKINGEVIDQVSSYFGFSKVETNNDSILVNGERVFQILVLDQGYYPEGIYSAPSDGALRRDIEISMEMGFNGARLHQKVFEPRYLYWADALGYMVWGEFSSWGIDMSSREACQNFISEWSEVLKRDLSHPSIIGWCPFNETPVDHNAELVRIIYNLTKTVDPGRPVIDTSGYTHVVTDVYDSHDYDQDVDAFRDRHQSIVTRGEPHLNHPDHDVPYAGQPVMVSEFGGTWWDVGASDGSRWGYGNRPSSESEFLSRFEGLVGALLENPKIAGFCYTQLYDIEQEVNGLYTYDRVRKFSPEAIRGILQRPAAYEEEVRAEAGEK